jgi:hypothetical protein
MQTLYQLLKGSWSRCNAEKTKYTIMSCEQITGQNDDIKNR